MMRDAEMAVKVHGTKSLLFTSKSAASANATTGSQVQALAFHLPGNGCMNSATAPAGRLFVCMIGQLNMNIENVTACSQRRRPAIPLLLTTRGRILHAGSGDRTSPYITPSRGGTASIQSQVVRGLLYPTCAEVTCCWLLHAVVALKAWPLPSANVLLSPTC